MKTLRLKSIVVALGATSALWSGVAGAATFALAEQSASGAGNAFAGAAAVAEDASTIFFNPAGLTRIKGSQFIVAGHAINIDASYSSQSAISAVGTPLTGGNGGNPGGTVFVPNLYYSTEINPALVFGVGVNVPFGLMTDYDPNWIGRYQALKSDVKTININPTLAWKVNEAVSLGAGIDAQYIRAELSNAIDFGSICFGSFGALAPAVCAPGGFFPQAKDGSVKVEGHDWSYGFNLGALFQVSPETRIGVAYRSKISHELSGGNASFSKPAGLPGPIAASPTFTDSGAKASITLPESFSLSVFSQINPQWAVLGDVTWTRWSRFKELRIRFDNGAPDSVTPEEWDDSYRVSLGASYQLNNAWKLRGGVAYDRTPVKDEFRTPRIPDNDRTWVAVGANYRLATADSLDFAYSHGFLKDASLNKAEPPVGGTLVGKYDTKVDVLSVQYTHSF